MIVVLELWEAQNRNSQNLHSQVFLSLPWGGGAGSDRKILVLSSILRSFCHSHAGLGPGSDRKTLVLELWEAQNLNSRFFLSLPRGAGSDRKTLVLELWEAQNLNCQMQAWGGGRAMTERPWFWSFGRPKPSILRSFCHSHAGLGGWGGRAMTERPWFWSFGRPKSSILRSFCHSHAGLGEGAGSDRKTLVWEAQILNSQVFLSLPCGPGGGGGQ